MKSMHSFRTSVIILIMAVMLFEGAQMGVSRVAGDLHVFNETTCPFGCADEESRGTCPGAATARAESLPVSHTRPVPNRNSARSATPQTACDDSFCPRKPGTLPVSNARLIIPSAVLGSVILRV